jgi:Gpi18-like mannosyltransferase
MEVNMLLREKSIGFNAHTLKYCALGLLFLLAIGLRIAFYHVITSDYAAFTSQWYDYIKSNGGFAAFKDNFYNYNPPYLYLIALATYTPIPKLIALKSISVIFDIVLAIFTYLIISLKYNRSYAAFIGALVLLFAPTIFINSSAWGQCDAIYASFCLGSLYFLLKDRNGWACTFFALAISFKLQAIFFLPVLLIVLIKRRIALKDLAKYLILIPVIFFVLLIPTLVAGRSVGSVLSIYTEQVSTGGVGGGAGQFRNGGFGGNGQFNGQGTTRTFERPEGAGQFNGQGGTRTFERPEGAGQFNGQGGTGQFNRTGGGGNGFSSVELTYNAPSFYQWVPADSTGYWKYAGILLAGLAVLGVGLLVWSSKIPLTAAIIIKVTLVLALAIPFLLPEMHERYFYLADVVSIVYAFYFPRSFYIAIIVQLCSLLSYAPYFYNTQIVSLGLVAFAVLIITLITLADLIFTLFPDFKEKVLKPEGEFDAETTSTTINAGPTISLFFNPQRIYYVLTHSS